ncbi:MAG: hypothetical protein QXM16_07950, partial [Nitrososphaerota archaeon]
RLMRGWSGFTLTGEEADEGSHEPVRSPRLMNPKSYTRPCSSEPDTGPKSLQTFLSPVYV